MKKLDNIQQSRANELIKVKKTFLDKSKIIVNKPIQEKRELISTSNVEDKFYFHISQKAIEFGCYRTCTRYFSIPLVRLCIDSDQVHENPDGKIIRGSHIHMYKEGHFDKFAYPLSEYGFTNENIIPVLEQFFEICNIEKIRIEDQRLMGDEYE